MRIELTISQTFSDGELLDEILRAHGSNGLQKLIMQALKKMDCADTYNETLEKIKKLPRDE